MCGIAGKLYFDGTCLKFGPELDLLFEKMGKVFHWWVNAETDWPTAPIYRALVDEVLSWDRETFDRAIDIRVTRIRRKIEVEPASGTIRNLTRAERYQAEGDGYEEEGDPEDVRADVGGVAKRRAWAVDEGQRQLKDGGDDEQQVLRQSAADALEEFGVEVRGGAVCAVGLPVAAGDEGHVRVRDVGAFHPAHLIQHKIVKLTQVAHHTD